MNALRRRFSQRRTAEDGVGLIEVIFAMAITLLIMWMTFHAQILGINTTDSTVQRNYESASWGIAVNTVQRDALRSQWFAVNPTGTAVEMQISVDEFVRFEFVLDDADYTNNVLLFQKADKSPQLGGEWSEPKVLTSGFITGSFESYNGKLFASIGDTPSVVAEPLSHRIPIMAGRTDEYVNAEYLLKQDVEAAVSKQGSTSEVLYLELTDGSYVRWSIHGSEVRRSTAVDEGAPFTDERVIMANAIGSGFSYNQGDFPTRDITFTTGGTSTTFTIPLRAPAL